MDLEDVMLSGTGQSLGFHSHEGPEEWDARGEKVDGGTVDWGVGVAR